MTASITGTKLVLTGVPGPAGEQGIPGNNGINGINGNDGPPGQPGADGADGAPGTPGSPGADGNDGQDGNDGSPGAPAAMQTIKVGSNVYTSDTLTEVVFPGASATLNGTILTIDCMKGEDGVDGTNGTDGVDGSDATVTAGSRITVLNGVVSNAAPSPSFAAISGGVTSSYPSNMK